MQLLAQNALPGWAKSKAGGRLACRTYLQSRKQLTVNWPSMTEFDPARLIVSIAAHQDRAAFATLFDYFAPRIKTFLMRRGASAAAADDLAQEALLTLWRKAPQFDPERATAAAWIFAIARNLRIDSLRRQQRADAYAAEDIAPDGPEQAIDVLLIDERTRRIRHAIDLLPPEQLRVVKLSFIDGLAHGAIADALNIPLGTVKSRLRLALLRLRENLVDLI